MNVLDKWNNDKAKNLGKNLLTLFGDPTYVMDNELRWIKPYSNIKRVVLINENIPHNFPSKHYDFVYSTIDLKVPPELACKLAFVSGSIIIDQLKGEVTARCGALIKNQVTLGFVYDLVKNRIKILDPNELKKEYGRRIMDNITSSSGKFDPIIKENVKNNKVVSFYDKLLSLF